jgi:hypothetical protein
MKWLFLSAAILLVISISFASAVSIDTAGMKKNVEAYNNKVDKAPGILKAVLGNESINMEITKNDGSIFRAGLDVVNARIERTIEGGWSNPTIIITTTESAINKCVQSKDPISTFQEQRELGQINIETNGWIAKAKMEAMLSSTTVLQFGYNLFFG